MTWNVTAGSTGQAIANASTSDDADDELGQRDERDRDELRAEVERTSRGAGRPRCRAASESGISSAQRDGHEQGRVAQRLRDRRADAHAG